MIGEWPGLAKGLNAEGNVRATLDFRGLYCSLLEQWLGHEAAPHAILRSCLDHAHLDWQIASDARSCDVWPMVGDTVASGRET